MASHIYTPNHLGNYLRGKASLEVEIILNNKIFRSVNSVVKSWHIINLN